MYIRSSTDNIVKEIFRKARSLEPSLLIDSAWCNDQFAGASDCRGCMGYEQCRYFVLAIVLMDKVFECYVAVINTEVK